MKNKCALKLNNYLKIIGIMSIMFRPQETRIKLYNTLALAALLYGSENWTIEARDTIRITAAEMTYKRKNRRIHLYRLQKNKILSQFWTQYRNTAEIVCNM